MVTQQWKHSVQEINGEVLCGKSSVFCRLLCEGNKTKKLTTIYFPAPAPTVSQFTLLASTKKGNKPDFHGAQGGPEARRLYEYFFSKVVAGYAAGPDRVKNGVFQAMMEVALINDGPVCVFVFI